MKSGSPSRTTAAHKTQTKIPGLVLSRLPLLSLLLLFLPKLLRGTRDRWVAQVSFIIIYSTGLAPFPRLSAPPHSSQQTSHYSSPIWFSLMHPAPLGLEGADVAEASSVCIWSCISVCIMIALLPGVLERVRRDRALLLLIVPRWPGRVWFPDLIYLLDEPPLELPIRRDLLSQAGGSIFHLQPELWKLWAWPLRGLSS